MRVLMLGTPAFAAATLEALLASRHEVVGLVCQPDRPRGRGQKVLEPPTKAIARARGLPVFQPVRLRDESFMAQLAELGADIGVVAAYGRLLPDALIALPARGMINVHASLLPKYRGAAPIQRAVMAGETETGATIMRVVRELDAGPMLASVRIPIGADETSVDVERTLAAAGAALLVETLDRLARGEDVPEVEQDHGAATHAPKIERADGLIDWAQPAARIHDQVRGLHPWPHAFTFLDGDRLLIHRTAKTAAPIAGAPGTFTVEPGGRLTVATGDGALEVLEIQPEGRRAMPAAAWLAGRRAIEAGRFEGQRAEDRGQRKT